MLKCPFKVWPRGHRKSKPWQREQEAPIKEDATEENMRQHSLLFLNALLFVASLRAPLQRQVELVRPLWMAFLSQYCSTEERWVSQFDLVHPRLQRRESVEANIWYFWESLVHFISSFNGLQALNRRGWGWGGYRQNCAPRNFPAHPCANTLRGSL